MNTESLAALIPTRVNRSESAWYVGLYRTDKYASQKSYS